MISPVRLIYCALIAGAFPFTADAQSDTLRLPELQSLALRTDPREAEIRLLQMQSDLRMRNLRAERLPNLMLDSYAQYQSDVARLPLKFPGVSIPTPPHDTYDARVIAQQRLYDPTLAPRRAVERAQTVSEQAKVTASLYTLRKNLTDAYFNALAAQEQLREIGAGVTDLEAQLRVVSARVQEGTALPGEENAIRAELLRRRQLQEQAYASRISALIIVFSLTGHQGDLDKVALAFPDTISALDSLPPRALTDLTRRPEIRALRSAQDLVEAQRSARSAQDRPRISAFGRAGYGRPGLNPLATRWDSYWLAGVQLQWSPFTWGTTGRDRQVLELQSRILAQEEASLALAFQREGSRDLVQISWLVPALRTDDEIIALREKILAETAARFREGAVTADVYVDKQTDVLSARIARSLHRVELARARAGVGNTLGLESK
jgi:outer membrane protein TolC